MEWRNSITRDRENIDTTEEGTQVSMWKTYDFLHYLMHILYKLSSNFILAQCY